jgi:phosphomannomutase
MSVSGIRGIVGDTLTPLLISRVAYLQTIGAAKECAAGNAPGSAPVKVVVGRDTRQSGVLLAAAAFRGIRAAGGVPIDIGIAPTPTTCFAVAEFGAAAGIIITASHNPGEYNGYKMVHSAGRLCRGDECEKVYAAFRADPPAESLFAAFADTPHETIDAGMLHIERICSRVNGEAIRAAKIKIAVDSTNGAGGAVFPGLLDQLGVAWVGVHNKLDGRFEHNPEPRPEHLGDLAALLHSDPTLQGGFAFDPDADRLATMGDGGAEISEEMTLVFCLRNLLSRIKSDVAVNLSTSRLIDDVAAKFGVRVFRTKIGEANVVEGMARSGCLIGGEGNGGLIYPAITTCRDGLAALAVIVELMATTGLSLTSLASEWPSYAIVKTKIPLRGIDPAAAIGRLTEKFAHERLDLQDGLKIIRPDGWVQVRASNTEPIMRCFAEAKSRGEAEKMAAMVIEALEA